jgi:hypothetical protein
MKKLFSLVVMLLGAGALYGSYYIKNQVIQGQHQIKKAQKQVGQLDSLLQMSPYTSPLGKGISGAAQDKIDEGQQEIKKYTLIANSLETGGYVGLGLGAFLFLLSFRRKKK